VLCGRSEKPVYRSRSVLWETGFAAVVAETEAIAAQARDLIEVEYEDLRVVCDVEEAMQPGAPILHPDVGSNVFGHHKLYSGDIEAGFSNADVIVESVLNTPLRSMHSCKLVRARLSG